MDKFKLLEKNPREIKRMLDGLVDSDELDKIDTFLSEQTKLMLKLSKNHLDFAKTIRANMYWRQKVSRTYYACYNASRAIRLIRYGVYSQDSTDHKKIDKLPDDFPSKGHWENFLSQFKADRNIADYDHISGTIDLNNSPRIYLSESIRFYEEVTSYLLERYGI